MDRCVGCRWHTPRKYGGQGIYCDTGDKCPDWVIAWALSYSKNGSGKPRKSFATDEALLEALRL